MIGSREWISEYLAELMDLPDNDSLPQIGDDIGIEGDD